MSHRGHYIFRVDASSLVAPYDAGASRAPELRSVAMTSQVQLPFTERMGAYLAGAPPARPAWVPPERLRCPSAARAGGAQWGLAAAHVPERAVPPRPAPMLRESFRRSGRTDARRLRQSAPGWGSGEVGVERGEGGGSFIAGVKRVLTRHDTLEAELALGARAPQGTYNLHPKRALAHFPTNIQGCAAWARSGVRLVGVVRRPLPGAANLLGGNCTACACCGA